VRTFVFTYDRFDSISTSLMLEEEGIDHIVLCHTDEQAASFVAAGRVKPERLTVTAQPKGLAWNRNAALDLMEPGEWAVFLVDDLKDVTELRNYDSARDPLPITTANQRAYSERFKKAITMTEFMQRAEGTVAECERHGAKLGGFCGIDNVIFRSKHWGFNILADGRAWVVQKSHLRFDTNVQLIDDLCWTALNIATFGVVVVDRWVLPDCRRYTAGAFGSIEERLPQKLQEAAYLVETYPDLIAFKNKAGWPIGSHVALRAHRYRPRARGKV
jgi:hypothetical protein